MTNNNVNDFNNELSGVRTQSIYLNLINDRKDKVEDNYHKAKVLTGYGIIMNLLSHSK